MINSFLFYLKKELPESYFNTILLPNKDSLLRGKNNLRNKIPNILRLDGCDRYQGNLTTLYYLITGNNLSISSKYFSSFDKHTIFPSLLINKYLARFAFHIAEISNCFIFQSKNSKDQYEKLLNFNTLKKPYYVIRNGTKFYKYQKKIIDSKTFGFPSCITSASNFRTIKRLDQTIYLCRKLKDFYPQIKLHIIGDISKLNLKLKDDDKNFVEFHGLLNFDEIFSLKKNIDLQFHLSCSDACPNSVVEGLMAGLPVIAPQQTGTSELLGEFSDQWCVNEKLNSEFFPTSAKLLPKIPVKEYLSVFHNIIENLEEYKYKAHAFAAENLCIDKTGKRYKEVIDNFM